MPGPRLQQGALAQMKIRAIVLRARPARLQPLPDIRRQRQFQ
jgi:hypothetical protein